MAEAVYALPYPFVSLYYFYAHVQYTSTPTVNTHAFLLEGCLRLQERALLTCIRELEMPDHTLLIADKNLSPFAPDWDNSEV